MNDTRTRPCDNQSVHQPHDWYELNLMWECPGTCAMPGDQEHDHEACNDVVAEQRDQGDWSEGSVRLMQTGRDNLPAFLGGAVDLCSAVRLLHELAIGPAFVWAEQRVRTLPEDRWLRWINLGSGRTSWRAVISAHLQTCSGCAHFLSQKLSDNPSARAMLSVPRAQKLLRSSFQRPYTPSPEQMRVLIDADERTWRNVEMALADALFFWEKAGNGNTSYAKRVESVWLGLFGDPTSQADTEQQRAERAATPDSDG